MSVSQPVLEGANIRISNIVVNVEQPVSNIRIETCQTDVLNPLNNDDYCQRVPLIGSAGTSVECFVIVDDFVSTRSTKCIDGLCGVGNSVWSIDFETPADVGMHDLRLKFVTKNERDTVGETVIPFEVVDSGGDDGTNGGNGGGNGDGTNGGDGGEGLLAGVIDFATSGPGLVLILLGAAVASEQSDSGSDGD